MSIYTTYCKYLCLAALAGVLATGVPTTSRALDLSGDTLDYLSVGIIDSVLKSDCDGIPVCSDQKGQTCSQGDPDAKCCSKAGKKLCQTCTKQSDGTYKWGTATEGKSCWDKKDTSFSTIDDGAVLNRF